MNKVRVLFNALVLYGAKTGYSRVFTEMLREYSAHYNSRLELFVLIQTGGLDSIEHSTYRYEGIQFIVVPNFRSKAFRGLIEQILVPLVAVAKRCSVIHMPSTFGLVFPPRPTLVTFHTGTSFMMPTALRGRGCVQSVIHNYLIRATTRTASMLAITTATTARELFGYLGYSRPHFIVGNGLPTTLSPGSNPGGTAAGLAVPKRYILCVSQFYRLKNHNRAISSFLLAKSTGVIPDDWTLVLVGAVQERDYYKECRESAQGRQDIYFLENVSDGVLASLYEGAALYLFLSRFEGFGMTPLEALAHNVPVVLSNLDVLREVYGSGFVYVDPLSDKAVVLGIAAALSPEYGMYCRGHDICEKYSWKTICGKYMNAYERLATPEVRGTPL